jgi:hypothetical protein
MGLVMSDMLQLVGRPSQYHLAVAGGSVGMGVDYCEAIHPLPRGGTDLITTTLRSLRVSQKEFRVLCFFTKLDGALVLESELLKDSDRRIVLGICNRQDFRRP